MTSFDGMLAGRNPDDLDRIERRELISAYLDDELPAHEARQITLWLDENPGALKEVEHIRRTWDLLDHYEDEPVPEGFAQRVLAAVGLRRSAVEPAGRMIQMAWYRKPQTWAAAAAVLLVAIGLIFTMKDDAATTPATPLPAAQASVATVIDDVPDDVLVYLDDIANLDDERLDTLIALGGDDLGG